jgi:hypothetical protein
MRAPSVPVSKLGRAAHDVGMAGMLGGNLFGRLALHPSVTEISDPAERGKVVNAAWRRYGAINSLSLVAVVAGWVGARTAEAADAQLSPTERRLARAKDALVGAVPLADGDHTAPNAPDRSRRMKQRLNALGLASIVTGLGLVAVNSALAQQNFRRPPARRFLKRR